jgi:hypothetical protein
MKDIIMTTKIIDTALSKKGRFATVQYSRPVKVKKGAPMITKVTRARQIRIGAQYDAMKVVQDAKGVTSTEEAHKLNTGLKGFEWVKYPTILKSIKTGAEYVRIETNSNSKFDTTYIMNGKIVTKQDIDPYILASERSKGDMPPVMNIKADYITAIN